MPKIYQGMNPESDGWDAYVEQMAEEAAGVRPFFVTIGTSQPLGPGYYIVWGETLDRARRITFEVIGQRWAFIYPAYNSIHTLDRIYLGSI